MRDKRRKSTTPGGEPAPPTEPASSPSDGASSGRRSWYSGSFAAKRSMPWLARARSPHTSSRAGSVRSWRAGRAG